MTDDFSNQLAGLLYCPLYAVTGWIVGSLAARFHRARSPLDVQAYNAAEAISECRETEAHD